MRGITPPSSRPHRRCRQSQRIESLAFTNLTRRNEHYRRRHRSIATSYDLLLPHRRRHLATPPDDKDKDEDDDDEDEDEDDDNEDEDEDEDDEDKDNGDEDDDEDEDDDDEDNNAVYYYYLILDDDDNNDDDEYVDDIDNNNNFDDEDSDDSNDHSYDNDDDNKDDEEDDDDDDDDEYDEAASVIECLRTQLSIVQRLIVMLGPNFQVSYSPSSHPDSCVISTLQDCIGLSEIICGLRLVNVPADYILTLLRRDCLLEGFRLSL
jgi:hypothetical protein